ncbi:hypothetical protein J7U46_02480 [Pelomonas sp. V22]|uniref:hypothetical protein n=1 Tax=Pelomonas sp. V22 TaxID=2822139 RepID=UPI0024A842E2|nr:hypothetical protein [Pelomonas sp. V22]MDI4631907.1 hypothetical protein [Pelomonas sp. V22]
MSGLLTIVIRVLLGLFTLVFVLALLGVAVVTMVGLLIWSLLRGRKPVIDMGRFRRASQFRPGQARRAAPVGEVVDVEAREVQSTQPRLDA